MEKIEQLESTLQSLIFILEYIRDVSRDPVRVHHLSELALLAVQRTTET
jgi:hypothetical protein